MSTSGMRRAVPPPQRGGARGGERPRDRTYRNDSAWLRLAIPILLVALSAHTVLAQSTASSAKPRVPPGRDPGGVAVAYIGGGVDYTRPEIAARLARDGEGEIIGWDFLDGDRRPLERCEEIAGQKRPCQRETFAAQAVLAAATISKLIILRVSTPRSDEAAKLREQFLVEAIKFTGATTAKIVLLDHAPRLLLTEAASRFPGSLFVIPAIMGKNADPHQDQFKPLPNVLVVRPFAGDAGSGAGGEIGDIATAGGGPNAGPNSHAGHIAGLAARLLAAEPRLDANALKQRIIGLAKPATGDEKQRNRHGVVSD